MDSKIYYETVHVSEQEKLYASVFAKSLALQQLIRQERPELPPYTPPEPPKTEDKPIELSPNLPQRDSVLDAVDFTEIDPNNSDSLIAEFGNIEDESKKENEVEHEAEKHVYRLLEHGDIIQQKFNCAIIDIDSVRVSDEKQNTLNAVLLFCENSMYVIEGYVIAATGQIEQKLEASNVSSQVPFFVGVAPFGKVLGDM